MTTRVDHHLHLLERLKAEAGAWVSGQAVCQALGCSRTAVWKQIETLRHLGYAIEARPRLGYRLAETPDSPIPEEVTPLLTTRRLGRDLTWIPAVDSTNRWMSEQADRGAAEGFALTADAQSAGRGRLDRVWHSPPGTNLYVSLLLRPEVPLDRAASLSLVLGLAVRRAILSLEPELDALVKWPNDVWVGGRKIAGILCEMRAEPDRVRHVVAGIGLNVNTAARDFPGDLARTATSMRVETGRRQSRPRVLAALLNQLEPLYDAWRADGLAPFADELDKADLIRGREVTLDQGGRPLHGIAAGLAPDGALLLESEGRITPVYSGDVTLRSIAGLRP